LDRLGNITDQLTDIVTVGGVSAAVSKTAAAPIERVKLLIQNQVCHPKPPTVNHDLARKRVIIEITALGVGFDAQLQLMTPKLFGLG